MKIGIKIPKGLVLMTSMFEKLHFQGPQIKHVQHLGEPGDGPSLHPRDFFLDFIYLFLERGEGKEKERERNIDVQEKH